MANPYAKQAKASMQTKCQDMAKDIKLIKTAMAAHDRQLHGKGMQTKLGMLKKKKGC